MEYVIYCRRSSDEASERQHQSIPDQIKRCLEYAEKQGLKIMKKPDDFSDFENKEDIFSEDNDSDPHNRKVFQETRDLFIVKESKTAKVPYKRKKRRKLIQYIEQGKIGGLLSFSPDRQARNLLEGGELIDCVDQNKVDLKYTNFHFEDSASGKMMLGVWFVFAKQYADAISENVHRGIEETLARGKALGTYKYGYKRNDEGYYQPDDQNFKLMKEAFRLKIYDKKSDKYIAQRLNDRGYKRYRKDKTIKITGKTLYPVWKDTFYYGMLCEGDYVSDQIEHNPYYLPLITQEEYELLADRRMSNKKLLTPKQIKHEYASIMCVPPGLLQTADGYFLTFNLPNKKRYYDKLKKLQKTNPDASLHDVVLPHQARYGVKAKESKYHGYEICGRDIDEAVIKVLKCFKPTKKAYNEYVSFFKSELDKLYKNTSKELNQINLRINYIRSELNKYVEANLSRDRDALEEEVYQKKKKEYEGKLFRLEQERDDIGIHERNTMIEYEVFLDMMYKAADYYKKASYVQKARINKIFFSNMVLTKEKKLHLAVQPIFEGLFMTSGADEGTRTLGLDLGKVAL